MFTVGGVLALSTEDNNSVFSAVSGRNHDPTKKEKAAMASVVAVTANDLHNTA